MKEILSVFCSLLFIRFSIEFLKINFSLKTKITTND